jgi:hypothetical protein
MAKDQNRRLTPSDIQADKNAQAALKALTDYNPSNKKFTADKVAAARKAMDDAQEEETQAEKAAMKARDKANAAEWAFHNMMIGTKNQVVAQYDDDSDEVQSMGLKKKSEYKKPGGRPKKKG